MATVMLLLFAGARSVDAAPRGRSVLAYWAFNCFTTCGDANLAPESVGLASASMTSSFEPDAGVNESGTTLNSISPYEARAAMTLRTGTGGSNNGRNLTWRVSTIGQANIQVSFAARRSPGGFSANQFQYSLDGVNFTDVDGPFDVGSTFTLVSYDLKRIRGLHDNPNAAFRIVCNVGSSSSAEEFLLIDNLQVVAK